MADRLEMLRRYGLHPTPQRLAVVEVVVSSRSHPTADEVHRLALRLCPTISRATVYNTLHTLAAAGVIHERTIREGVAVYDADLQPHHHLLDVTTAEIHDLPSETVQVNLADLPPDFEVVDVQVVVRARRRSG